jgi:prevent-host-death family protein
VAIDETVSAAEANRSFSRLLRGVREGRSYVVTSHGLPVARLVPATQREEEMRQFRRAARKALFERLSTQPALNLGKWTRDELYDC